MRKIFKKILHMEETNDIMGTELEVFVNSDSNLNVGVSKDKRIECIIYLSESMQSKHTENTTGYVCKNVQMINIVDAAKYLVQLYYKTGSRYHCTRTKIEKLLSIASFVELSRGRDLFIDKNVINPCGTGYPILANHFFGDIIDGTEKESNCAIKEEYIDENIQIPAVYEIDGCAPIPEHICKLLSNVFFKFGNYEARKLGIILDEFKNDIVAVDEVAKRDVIDKEMASTFFNNQEVIRNYSDNEIISYIKNFEE